MNLVVYGTRPEEIKLWGLSRYPGFTFLEVNQSKDLHQGLIIPDIRANEEDLKDVIYSRNWKKVIVQGDTRTAFRAALYAFEAKIPVVHIEAGLRTGQLDQPFPEEGYRRMIDEISSYHYCPTYESCFNLPSYTKPMVVGQTSLDTLLNFAPEPTVEDVIVVTVHRREANVEGIAAAINTIKKKRPRFNVRVFAHPNEVGQRLSKLTETEPHQSYRDFIHTLSSCFMVMTDSGGLQEEAPSLNKPYIVLREVTERPEGIESGCGVLGGMTPETILKAFYKVETFYKDMTERPNPYGDGQSSERIIRDLCGVATKLV